MPGLGLSFPFLKSSSKVAPGVIFEDETLAYSNSAVANGSSIGFDGLTVINDLWKDFKDLSIIPQRGYLFGRKVNLPASKNKVLDLVGISDWTFHGSDEWHVNNGSAYLLGEVNSGYLETDPLFTNADWSMYIHFYAPTRDNLYPGSNEDTILLSQYPSQTDGKVTMFRGLGGGVSLYCWGSTVNPIFIKTVEVTTATSIWIDYTTATRTLDVYDATRSPPTLIDSTVLPVGGFTAGVNTRIGFPEVGGIAPKKQAWMSIFRFPKLNATQKGNVFPLIYDAGTAFSHPMVAHGTSVLSGSTANVFTNSYMGLTAHWAIDYDVQINMADGQGGMSICDYRASTYTIDPARVGIINPRARHATGNVDVMKRWRPKHVLFFDDQNGHSGTGYGANPNSILYADELRVVDGMQAAYNAVRQIRPLVCTSMNVGAMEIADPFDPLTWAEVNAEQWYHNLLDWGKLRRVDTRYETVVEFYPFMGGGWATVDGDAADPINDLPNGYSNVSTDNPLNKIFYTSGAGQAGPQHPVNAGHAELAFRTKVGILIHLGYSLEMSGGDYARDGNNNPIVLPTAAVIPDFSANATSGFTPATFDFTDLSENGASSWLWSFGDSATSTAQNPTHTYTVAGVYTVSLTASNSIGGDTETKTNYITVTDIPASLIKDTFSDDQSPTTTPRTCVPGPGTLVLVETAGTFSNSSNNLNIPVGNSVWGGSGFYDNTARARAAGRLMIIEVQWTANTGYAIVGFVNNTAVVYSDFTATGGIEFAGDGNINNIVASAVRTKVGVYSGSTIYRVVCIQRASGGIFLIKGGSFTNWTNLFMTVLGTETNLRPALSNHSQAGICKYIDVPGATYVPAPLINDGFSNSSQSDGLGVEEPGGDGVTRVDYHGTSGLSSGKLVATALGSSPSYTITGYDSGEKDPALRFILNCGTETAISGFFRLTDKDNTYIIRLDNTANFIRVVKREAASETNVASFAYTIADNTNYNIQAHLLGTELRLYSEFGFVGIVTGLTFQQTATKHGILFEGGTSGSADNFACFEEEPSDVPVYCDASSS